MTNEPRIILGAWGLKKQGFPQPEIEAGQVWISLLDHAHLLHDSPFGLVTEHIGEAKGARYRLFGGVVTEGMAYCPTKDEYIQWFKTFKV